MNGEKNNGRFIALAVIVMVGIIGLSWYLLNRESIVRGQVTMDGTSIAAGQIQFRSTDREWSAPIESGRYEIRGERLAGEYKVRIDVHFVDAADASEFYSNLTKELNRKSPKSSQNTSLDSLDSYHFQTSLANGGNTKDFQLSSNN